VFHRCWKSLITVLQLLQGDRLEDDDYYIENNGRIINDEDTFVYGNNYYVRLRVLGGKGGVENLSSFCIYTIPMFF